jgi:hypothetical protein
MQTTLSRVETQKKKLKIEIPEIDDEIFEKRIIDGVPTINKPIKCKSAYQFWKDLEESDKKNMEDTSEINKN